MLTICNLQYCHLSCWFLAGCLLLGVTVPRGRADDPPVSIADLAAYQAALAPAASSPPAAPVTFRDLWDRPEAYQGRPVAVSGRLARRFRQPSLGQFPPLTEAWITSPLGEPTCLVFPSGPGQVVPEPGAEVRFAGTFLRRIEYAGGDTRRIAPLIVGPTPPVATSSAATGPNFGPIFGGDHAADWAIGLGAALGVGLILLRRHLSRPPSLAVRPPGPPPAFRDGGEGDEFDEPARPTFGGPDDDDR